MCERDRTSTHRRALGSVCLALGVAATPCWSAVDWALFPRSCGGGVAASVEIRCGDYGVFELIGVGQPGACNVVASGAESPPAYPRPAAHEAFPIPARPLQAVAALPWIAVIDFDGPHGDSTTALVDAVAGSAVDAYLARLDDPALAPLGSEVGDFHVLAQLCAIAELVDVAGAVRPLAVNMSFGRMPQPTDPRRSAECDTRAACQIANVVAHLRSRGIAFVAAAGNHQELLFPAQLDDVVPAGMLDLNGWLHTGTIRPAWETPPGAHAWIPGNALCLGNWAAPAGSSYSSAMLTGWLAKPLASTPPIDPTSGGSWQPRWHPAQHCWVLAQGQRLTPWCNAEIGALFAGLAGQSDATCWSISAEPSAALPLPGAPQGQPVAASLDEWMAATHPTPESDPCVPCVGQLTAAGGSAGPGLSIDFSQSPPLNPGVYLDRLYLRAGGAFHELTLQPAELQSIQLGTLSKLVLDGAGSWIAPGQSLSLWYTLKHSPTASCATVNACAWSSTPILMKGF